VAPNTSNAGSRKPAGLDGTLGAIVGLLIGVVLLTTPTAAHAFNPTLPTADAPVSEGCCGPDTDEDYTFRGYTAEVWDEAPTVSELNLPQSGRGLPPRRGRPDFPTSPSPRGVA
jgi:hypothetical protein